MAKRCINHPDAEAAVLCHQCHKPICSECAIVAATGSFCSSDCNLKHSLFVMQMPSSGKGTKMGVIGCMVTIVLLIVAALIVIHFAAKVWPALEGIDLVGDLIGGLRKIFLSE